MTDSITFKVRNILDYAPSLADVRIPDDEARKKTCQRERFLDTVYACIDSLENQPFISRWEKDIDATNDCFFRIFAEDLLLEEAYLHANNNPMDGWKWEALERLSYKLVYAYQNAHGNSINSPKEPERPHPVKATLEEGNEEEEPEPLLRRKSAIAPTPTSQETTSIELPQALLSEKASINESSPTLPVKEKELASSLEPLLSPQIEVLDTTLAKPLMQPMARDPSEAVPAHSITYQPAECTEARLAPEKLTALTVESCALPPCGSVDSEEEEVISAECRAGTIRGQSQTEKETEEPTSLSESLPATPPSGDEESSQLTPRSDVEVRPSSTRTAVGGPSTEHASFSPMPLTKISHKWKKFNRQSIHTKARLFSHLRAADESIVNATVQKLFREKDRLTLVWAAKESLLKRSIIWRRPSTQADRLQEVKDILKKLSAHEKFELLHRGMYLFQGERQKQIVNFFAQIFVDSFQGLQESEKESFLGYMREDGRFEPVLELLRDLND